MRIYTTLLMPLLILLSIVLMPRLYGQTNNLKVAYKDAASAPRNLNVCGDEATVTVTVSTEGVLSAARQNISATLNLFKGVKFVRFESSGSSAGVTYAAGANTSQAVFSLPTLSPIAAATVNISYVVRVNCEYTDTLTRNDLLDVRDRWNFNYAMNAQSLTETDFNTGYRDQIKVPFFTMTVADNTNGAVRVGQCFQRKIVVNNSGLDGFIKNFVYTNMQGAGVSVTSVSVNGTVLPVTKTPAFNAAGDTLIRVDVPASVFAANTIGATNPSNGNLLFEPNETVTITENFCVANCDKPRTSSHAMNWGCDNRYCNSVTRTSIVRLGEGMVNVAFQPSGSIPNITGGYCRVGNTGVIFTNNGVEIDQGTATMFNISTGIGLGDNVGLQDKGFKITKMIIAGVVFNTPSVAIQDLNNSPLLRTDPDGTGVGLADIDGDGFFDDLPRGQRIEIRIEYTVECGVSLTNTANKCVNDFESAFNAQIDYTDGCNKRNSIIQPRFFAPLNVNDLIENCADPDCGTDSQPFNIQHLERRNIFNFERDCGGQEEILVKIKLPVGVVPIQDSMRLYRYTDIMTLKSMTQSNDTVFLRFSLAGQAFINGDYKVNMGFKATCDAQPGLSNFPTELSFVCPPCNCQHVWYCDTIQGPKIHYYAPPCVPNAAYECPKGLKTTSFSAVRTTLGYTTEKYTTKIDPSKANLKVAMSCDSIRMTVNNVVGNTPLTDSLGIKIYYENITYLAASRFNDIFKFGKGVVRIVKGGQVFNCNIDTSKVRYVRTDSAKYMYFDLNYCFAETGITSLNKGDSVNFIGNFTVEDNGPFKNTFEKIPRFRAYGYHIDNATEFACDDFGETFRVGRPASVFSIPSSSNFPKGCTEATLDYKILVLNNGYFDYFGFEHRKSIGVDSITFAFDTAFLKAFTTSVSVSIPDHPFAGNSFYPLSNLDATGRYVAKFDTLTIVPSLNKVSSYAFDLRIKALPNCRSLVGSSLNDNVFGFRPKIFFRDRYYAREIGDGSCSPYRRDSAVNNIIYNDPPMLSLTPVSNPTTTTNNDTASWTVKLCNTSDKGNAGSTWFSVEPDTTVQRFRVVKMTDITNTANHISLPVKYYSADSLKAFAYAAALKIANTTNTLDDVCNIIEVKALVNDCGEVKANINSGWNCTVPTQSDWSPLLYPPCTNLTLPVTVSVAAPFLDASYINQSLARPEICDTTTLEILMRNTDLGKVFDVRTRITVPLDGANLALDRVEIAYPPSAPYQAILLPPTLIGANLRGKIYEFINFSLLSNYLNVNGLQGFNPTNPNDSNEFKLRFRFSNECEFKSGSLSFFSFLGKTSCNTSTNNESGESLPIQILGAEQDSTKLFSVGVSPNNKLVPGGESVLEIFATNLTTRPTDVNDNISIKLPAGIRYKANTSASVTPVGWTPAEPTIRTSSGFDVVEWKMPVGLLKDQVARLRFTVTTTDTFSCNAGAVDMALVTLAEHPLTCTARNTICRVETITTSDGEQYFQIPFGRDSLKITASLAIANGSIKAVRNQPLTLTANGATAVRWVELPENTVLSTALILNYTPTKTETTIRLEPTAAGSCLAPAQLRILTDRDTAPPTIRVRDTTIGCRDSFPLIFPIVTDDVDTNIRPTYTDSLVNLACGRRLFRTWTARDSSGKSASALQTITQTDTVKPVFTTVNPLLAGVRSGDTLTYNCVNAPIFDVNDVRVTDNCTDNVPKSFIDVALRAGVCSRDGFLMLMECDWRATDACGNTAIFKIFVKITDNTPPILVNIPLDVTVSSAAEVPTVPQNVFGRDGCDDNVTVSFAEIRTNDSTITRTWRGADDCQNTVSKAQKITVRTTTIVRIADTIPPQYLAQNALLLGRRSGDTLAVFNCTNTPSFKTTDVRVTDNQDAAPRVLLDSVITTGVCNRDGFVLFKRYTWSATDSSGNNATFTINIRTNDTIAPSIVNVPRDTTLPSVPTDLPNPMVSDECSTTTLDLDTQVMNSATDTIITRTWTATDACGNQATAHQIVRIPVTRTFRITDSIPPTITFVDAALVGRPQNGDTLTFNTCFDLHCFKENSILAADNQTLTPSVLLDSTMMYGFCPTNDFNVLKSYTWTAKDSANNHSTFKLWLKYVDNVPPTIDNVPANITILSTAAVPYQLITVTDDCSRFSMDSTLTSVLRGIDTVFVRTWIATDACGNVSNAQQTILKFGTSNNGSSTVWTPQSDTTRLQLATGQSDTICLRKRPNSGGYSVRNICPDSTTRSGAFEILTGDTCVVLFAVSPGRSTACFQVCDSTGVCDTTVLTINTSFLIRPLQPIAVDDSIRTNRGQSVDIAILQNDTLNNGIVTSVGLMLQPRFGQAEVREKGGDYLIHFQSDSSFCSSKLQDEFYYELCTTGGCDRAFVRVRILCDGLKINNAFSPNDDGKNDVFFLEGLEFFPNTTVTIYNRWGNSVYSSKDYKNDWNGTHDGKAVPNGTYFYLIRLENGKTFSGYLELMR
ncbi:MAG: gliding motility-associated C-terminal domain-containing protein [Saprospiraceae bacterium]|nr:gliding motility-associated C-terminal domain-containing protein [Saprospiraceae bacterium]